MAGCTEEREDGQTAQAWRIHLICREQAAFANWDVLVWSEIKPTLAGAWDSFRESEMQKMMDRGVQVEQEKISMGTTPVGEVD